MSSIVLESVTKAYGSGALVVRGVDLTIDSGEFMVFVGPSGCGKSTLLRMVAGLEEVTDGRILIGDREVTHLSPRARDIAMVFQNYALYPHMSVRENLGYALKVAKVPKTEIAQRVDDVAKMLGLVELMDRRPAALSGGQRQRVAMGRAIVRRPSAYLMDEPLSNLDAKLRVSMRAELANLHERLGVTTIYVTHDQVEAMTLGQRVAVINEGVIQQVDTPQNLYRNPANLFVAGFIGSPSMNLVEATVADGTLVIGQFAVPLHETHRSLLQGRGRVVVGVRPDSFEDSLWSESDLPRIQVEVSVVEELGAEAHVFFPVDAPRIDTGSSGDDSEDALLAESAGRSRFVARVDSRSTIRPGARVSLTIDPSRFHFFDVGTGQSLRAETPAPVG